MEDSTLDSSFFTISPKAFPKGHDRRLEGIILYDNMDPGQSLHSESKDDLIGVQIHLKSITVFFFCLGGTAVVKENSKVHTLQRGDVIMSVGGYVSELAEISDDLKFMYIAMENGFSHPEKSVFQMTELMQKLSHDPTCHLEEEELQECITLYRGMKKRLAPGHVYPLLTEIIQYYSLTVTMMVFCAKLRQKEDNKVSKWEFSRKQDLYRRFMDELTATGGTERGMAYYADKLCVTQRYLSRVVKEVSGKFASEHIDSFVIDKARQLLSSHKHTVLQVSEMLGFSSHTVFTKYFRKQTGMTPSEFQKS